MLCLLYKNQWKVIKLSAFLMGVGLNVVLDKIIGTVTSHIVEP